MITSTANNNFKIYIKGENEIIFWLLEWNKYYRTCGFIGEQKSCNKIINLIPETTYKYIGKDENNMPLFFRKSTPLKNGSADFRFY